jgi:hypothetical protein
MTARFELGLEPRNLNHAFARICGLVFRAPCTNPDTTTATSAWLAAAHAGDAHDLGDQAWKLLIAD